MPRVGRLSTSRMKSSGLMAGVALLRRQPSTTYVLSNGRCVSRWLADLLSSQIDFNEQTQRYCVGVTSIIKVTLRDGVYHEDVGFGMLDNCKQKGMALDKVPFFSFCYPLDVIHFIQCKKEAVTDGL